MTAPLWPPPPPPPAMRFRRLRQGALQPSLPQAVTTHPCKKDPCCGAAGACTATQWSFGVRLASRMSTPHKPLGDTAPPQGTLPPAMSLQQVHPTCAHTNHVSAAPLRRANLCPFQVLGRQHQEQCWRCYDKACEALCAQLHMPAITDAPTADRVTPQQHRCLGHTAGTPHVPENDAVAPSPSDTYWAATAWAAWAPRHAAAAFF